MAESQRKAPTQAEMDDAAQKRKDMIFMILFFLGLLALVAGMWWLSGFLGGN